MTRTVDIPVRKRLREPLAAFLDESLKMWEKDTPHPVGRSDLDCYYPGWTNAARRVLESEGVIPMLNLDMAHESYADFIVEELQSFEQMTLEGRYPEGVEITNRLRLAADLLALAADVQQITNDGESQERGHS